MRTRRDIHPLLAMIVLLPGVLSTATAWAQDPPSPTDAGPQAGYACGPMSLTTLLRLEGVHTTLDQVNARLAARPAHSLVELRQAARDLGLELRGVRIDPKAWPLDRPALVRLDRGGIGHFVVVRPIGHTGELAQVIDVVDGVRVEDARRFFASKEWTGVALIPARMFDDRKVRAAMIAGPVIACIGLLAFLYRGSATSGADGLK